MSTQQRLSYDEAAGVGRVVSPYLEFGAYEAVWMREGITVKRMADLFRAQPEALPSDLVAEDEARAMAERMAALLRGRASSSSGCGCIGPASIGQVNQGWGRTRAKKKGRPGRGGP